MSTGVHLFICFIPLLTAELIVFALFKKSILLKMQIAVLAGLLVLIPVTLLQTVFLHVMPAGSTPQTMTQMLFYALIINGFIEETCKTGILFVLPAKDTPQTAFFALAVIIGLSFGCFEAVIYLISSGQAAPLRLITAVLLHGICSGLSSFMVFQIRAQKHLQNKKEQTPYIQAVLLHGLYNFFSALPGFFRVFPLLCLLVGIYKCADLLQKQKTAC